MKKIILALAAVTLLASCGGNNEKEIGYTEALSIAEKIAKQGGDKANFTVTIKSESVATDVEAKKDVHTVSDSTLKINSDGEFDFASKATVENKVSSYHYYYVLHEKLGAVIYAENEGEVSVTARSIDSMFDFELATYQMVVSMGTSYVTMFSNPLSYIPPVGSSIPEGYEFKYYSTGEKNLTVKVKMTVTSAPNEQATEYATSSEYVIKYDNLTLASVSLSSTSNLGHTSKMDLSVAFSDTKLSIVLPEGWERYIEN